MNGTQRPLIAAEMVDAVLLADGWHKAALGSFTIGALSFGDGDDRGVLCYRFEEISNGSLHRSATLAGPLDAVLAVRQVTSRRPLQQEDATGQGWSAKGRGRVPQHLPGRLNSPAMVSAGQPTLGVRTGLS
jgi:hypothetical protein